MYVIPCDMSSHMTGFKMKIMTIHAFKYLQLSNHDEVT